MLLPLQDHNSTDPGMAQPNGTLTKVDPQPQPPSPSPSPDLLGDLLGPLAIEGPPVDGESEQNVVSGLEGVAAVDAAAIVPVTVQTNAVEVCIYYLFVILVYICHCGLWFAHLNVSLLSIYL